jgi:predicted transcriptional regulator
MDIAQILKDRRAELGIPQDDLAKHCGFAHRSNISRLENGKLEWKYKDVIKACKLLGIKIEVVLR